MDWKLAHRIAGMAAAQAHRDLEIDRSTYVPIHDALLSAGLAVVARPMGRLFGMYFAPNDKQPAGVLLNAGLDVINQRHTAAHELGHHCQGHSTAIDNDLDRSSNAK
jgi:antirestriction protein ArdC